MKINNLEISTKAIVLFCISLIGFYFLNVYTNIATDDFLYKFIMTYTAEDQGYRVNSFVDLVISMRNHYFIRNGRILVNGLAQLFLISDNKLFFNLINTVLFGFFQFLILKKSNFSTSINTYKYLLILVLMWFLIPAPNHTLLWLDGSTNYLWSTILVLLFLLFFEKINSTQIKSIYFPLLLIFGFIAGFTHEVLSVGVSGALCIEGLKNFNKYKAASFIVVFGFIVGTLLMVVAPGNIMRLTSGEGAAQSLLMQIAKRIFGLIISYQSLSAFWILVIVMSVLFFKDKMMFKEIYKKQEILFHSIFISLSFVFFAGVYDSRVFFGISIFSICIILTIISSYQNILLNSKIKFIILFTFFLMFFEFSSVVLELRENKTQFDKDEKEWMSNNENVYVLSKKNTNRFTSFGLGMEDRYFWSNLAMSWYYNKKFMMFIPSELFHNLYETNTLISSKNQIKLVGLKNRLDTLKIYATSKKEFFIYKLPTNVSEKISSSILVNYISSAQTEINKFGIKSSIKNKLLNNANISTEQQSCYVLPTKIGDFLVFKSPLNIPFQSINKIQILSKNPDKFPVFEF